MSPHSCNRSPGPTRRSGHATPRQNLTMHKWQARPKGRGRIAGKVGISPTTKRPSPLDGAFDAGTVLAQSPIALEPDSAVSCRA